MPANDRANLDDITPRVEVPEQEPPMKRALSDGRFFTIPASIEPANRCSSVRSTQKTQAASTAPVFLLLIKASSALTAASTPPF